jgi:two-component system, sensor histidine kinase YesM
MHRVRERMYGILENIFKINSIQSIITLSFTAVTILSIIFVSVALYGMFSQSAEKNAASSTQQIMDQVNLNMGYYLKGMMEISDIIESNLNSDSNNNKNSLTSLFNVTSKIRKDIVTLTAYTNKGELFVSIPTGDYNRNSIIVEQGWFDDSIKKPGEYIFLPPHVQRLYIGKHPWVVSLCRGVTFYERSELVNWVTVVDMNFSVIEQLCKKVSFGKRGYIYVIDKYGNIIYHPQQQIIYAGLKDENIKDALSRKTGSYFDNFLGERRIMTIKNISYTDWKMVGISYVDEVVENKRNFNNFVIFIPIFVIAFGILASLFISAKISQPIKTLEKQMKRVEMGDFDINLDVKGEDEVKHLSKSFNIMVVKIRQLMEQIISEQEAKRKSDFKALQAQINPHFLYNTLDSIVWMNENRKYEGVTTMVEALARFFRVSISKGNEIISVSDELEHARSYLIIQKIRYKDMFDFTIEAQPEVLACKTLKLILQPIIENAIYHGIKQLHEKGEIKITASLKDNKILFQVIDNGYGIKPSFLKGILDRESKNEQNSGVGLKNVNERIKLCFGQEFGLDIISELDIGTTVNFWIPLNDITDGGKHENNS